jgi:hypothetical protein
MFPIKKTVGPVLVALMLSVSGAVADESATLKEAFAAGSTSLALRYRVESVSDDAIPDKDALASTLRSVLAFRSGAYKNFQFYIEAENVAALPNDNLFNNAGGGDSNNGVRDRPVIADPDSTEINQVYLQGTFDKTTLRAGRQELKLGDQRFVGPVGWRQNFQSFNALTVVNKSLADWTLSYSFTSRVHRIFGDSQDMASHLLNASGQVGKAGKLTLYSYLLDYDDPATAGLSTSTFGAELAGSRAMGNGKLLYEIEYATQQDFADNPNNIDASYTHVSLGGGTAKLTGRAGLERLDGSSEDGQFRTPLATLHKFNGWADKFLATPVNGLDDLYFTVGGAAGAAKWAATYHDFQAVEGSDQYGTEIDLLLTYKTSAGLILGWKAALYDADLHSTDTDKLMFWAAYTFK